MPGSVATLTTCSSTFSWPPEGSSAFDANTTPGTRIAPCRSIRKRNGVSSTSSTGDLPPAAEFGRHGGRGGSGSGGTGGGPGPGGGVGGGPGSGGTGSGTGGPGYSIRLTKALDPFGVANRHGLPRFDVAKPRIP